MTQDFISMDNIVENFSTLSLYELYELFESLGLYKRIGSSWVVTKSGMEIAQVSSEFDGEKFIDTIKFDYNKFRSMLNFTQE